MAGKKRDGGSVKVKITDDGSLKNLGKNAKKAGKDVGSVAKNVQESDRRLKSLSNQTSNSTKAFSKQAQTIGGGLVPIYATIAAQVFAVSAAFRFLQDAMETRNMVEGQKAFGAVTGQAFATMTSSVQKATANMLSFKEAASGVAIGSAAGLTRTQLEGLGTVAKNASLALGRDLTDAFNRLIRGVTKAEPELLDELGIILRLEPATEKYAAAIGKTREALTAFERSQAVANEVLEQGAEKFGRITEIMDESAFVLGQFAKEFDDLTKVIKLGLAEFLIPIISFLKDNITSLIGVFGLLAAPIVSQIIPDFGKMAAAFDRAADSSRNMGKQAGKDLKLLKGLKGGGDIGKQAQKDFMASGTSGMQSMLAGQDMTGQSATLQKAALGKKLNAKELGVLKRHLKQKNNMIGNMTKQDQLIFDRYIKHQELGLKGSMTKAKLEYKQLGLATNKYLATTKVGFGTVFGTIAKGASFAGRAVSKLLGAFGWISLAFIAFDGIRAMMKGTEEDLTKAQQAALDFKETLTELNTELARMSQVRREGFVVGGLQVLEQQANSLKSSDILGIIREFNKQLEEGTFDKEAQSKLLVTATQIEQLVPKMKGFAEEFAGPVDQLERISMKNNAFVTIANDIMLAGQAMSQFSQQMQSLDKQRLSLVTGFGSNNKFANILREIDAVTGAGGSLNTGTIQAMRDAQGDSVATQTQRQKDLNKFKELDKLLGTGAGKSTATEEETGGNMTLIPTLKSENKNREAQFAQLVALADTPQGQKILQDALGLSAEELMTPEIAAQSMRKAMQNNKGANALQFSSYRPGKDGDMFKKGFDAIARRMGIEGFDQMQSDIDVDVKADKAAQDEIDRRDTLRKINESFAKAIRDEDKVIKSIQDRSQQNKIDTLDSALIADKRLLMFEKDRITTDTKLNALDKARMEQRIAEKVLAKEKDTVDSENLKKLEDQVEFAKLKTAEAQKELDIQRQLLGLPFQKFTAENVRMGELNKGLTSGIGGSYQNRFATFLQGDLAQGALQNARTNAENQSRSNMISNDFSGTNLEEDANVLKQQAVDSTLTKLEEEFRLREKISAQMKLQTDIATRLTEGLANDMAGALVEVAKGTKTMKQAFGDMAISILADITKMIIKQLILNALMAMVGMVNPGAAASLGAMMGMTGTPARQGGIMQQGGNGGYRSYRSGGIADGPEGGYPATLHGTEAVVPLGNDKEIPVKMLSAGGGTNNVTVNVSMSDGSATQDIKTEGEKAKAFGASISAAVQQEIVKQQRAGGLLNSY